MKVSHRVRSLAVVLLTLLAVAAFAAPAQADHSWGNYHWARTSNPFELKVGDNVHSAWDAYLDEAITDWNNPEVFEKSIVLQLTEVAGGTNPKNCRATNGRIEVCAAKYGFNGWLGLAQIWASGDHITQAIAKLNDSYFNTSTYNTPAWRRLVMCQEIAHDFGLGHQDETFDNQNLGSCMDYTNDPDGGAGGASSNDPSNEHPNAHDFDQIEIIYNSHDDSTTTIGALPAGSANGELNTRAEWGRLVKGADGRGVSIYERDLPGGLKMITFVTWAHDHARADSH